jgi:hypothetical protein
VNLSHNSPALENTERKLMMAILACETRKMIEIAKLQRISLPFKKIRAGAPRRGTPDAE